MVLILLISDRRGPDRSSRVLFDSLEEVWIWRMTPSCPNHVEYVTSAAPCQPAKLKAQTCDWRECDVLRSALSVEVFRKCSHEQAIQVADLRPLRTRGLPRLGKDTRDCNDRVVVRVIISIPPSPCFRPTTKGVQAPVSGSRCALRTVRKPRGVTGDSHSHPLTMTKVTRERRQ